MQSRDAYLDALGVTQWVPRAAAAPRVAAAAVPAVAPAVASEAMTQRPQWLLVDSLAQDPANRIDSDFASEVGQLMAAMLRAVQLSPQQVLVAPADEQLPGLVAASQPRLVLALGEAAAQALSGRILALDALRGSVQAWGALRTPLVASYHPAQLLRDASLKRKAWEDLKLARASTPQDKDA